MADPDKAAAEELQKIEKQMRELAQQKAELEIYQRVKARLEGAEKAPSSAPSTIISEASHISSTNVPRANNTKATVILIAQEVLAKDGPAPTRTILQELNNRGVEVGGKDKVLAVSKILSENDSFSLVNRKEGWTLAGAKKARPESAGTDSGLFTNSGDEPDHKP